jgi:ribonuclease P protein component
VQRLKTRAQFEAVMSGGATVSRTEHFALHRAGFQACGAQGSSPGPASEGSAGRPPGKPTGPGSRGSQALFAVQGEPWLGVIVPKRWARRAVTRNAIKRQIYTVSQDFEARLPAAAHVVRLRAGFDRAEFHSATSPELKKAVRDELQRLFAGARP